MHLSSWVGKKSIIVNNFGNVEIKAQNNEAYNQSVRKRNTTPVLIERKRADKKIEPNIW